MEDIIEDILGEEVPVFLCNIVDGFGCNILEATE